MYIIHTYTTNERGLGREGPPGWEPNGCGFGFVGNQTQHRQTQRREQPNGRITPNHPQSLTCVMTVTRTHRRMPAAGDVHLLWVFLWVVVCGCCRQWGISYSLPRCPFHDGRIFKYTLQIYASTRRMSASSCDM